MTEGNENLLAVNNLNKNFGGFTVVQDLSFSLDKGKIVGLVGPNGAGKTTVFNLISGFLHPDQGKVVFKGRDITHLSSYEIPSMGLVRTFQLNKVFSNLTIEENIQIGCHKFEKGGISRFLFGSTKKENAQIEDRVEKILRLVGLEQMRGKMADTLSYGDQKLLGIGIALGAGPILLLLDEPFAGLNPSETMRCMSLLRQILERGTTILIVDHNMRAVMGFCNWILVLNLGKKIAEGPPEEICRNPEVISCYLEGTAIAKSR